MKNQWLMVPFVLCILFASGATSAQTPAETEQAARDEKLLRDMTREERERGFQELSRSVTNLERKVTRLSDRIDRMEYDLKEVKRKVRE